MPDPVFLSGADVPDYLKGVELMSAGMEWHASTGDHTFTLEHLADAVIAANEDPHIQPPRIKLGHRSAINGDTPMHDPFVALGDAEPCFGQFVNLRLENDGAVLVGDATNVPAWLAAMAPSAYPNRSSECVWQVDSPSADVQTNAGKRYSMVVTAVALLGVELPAISDLEDLETLLMSGPAALTAAPPASMSMPAAADLSISVDTIWQRCREWLMGTNDVEDDTYWWWPRDIRADGSGKLTVIIDDERGHLYEAAADTDGADEVTFDMTGRVRDDYVPVAASQLVASFARPARPSKPSRKPAASAANTDPAATGRPDDPEGGAMDEHVRSILVGQGIEPDTATEAQITAATQFAAAFPATPPSTDEPPEQPEAEGGDEPTGEAEGDEVGAEAPERVPVAAKAADPIAAAQKQAFDSLAAEVATLRAERDAQNTAATAKRRDEAVHAALTAGRITPAEREHYRGLLDVDEERAGQLLSALPAGRVPLEARAVVPDPDGNGLALDENGLLKPHMSLLTSSQRTELLARRGA